MNNNVKCCTNCGLVLKDKHGSHIQELYDVELFKKSKILKLVACRNCEQVADRYIEQDGTLILIDLILQCQAAYRHVLLNGTYTKLILKMALLTLICDGYVGWANLSSPGEFFEQEYEFYVMTSKVALSLLCFLLVVLIPTISVTPYKDIRTLLIGLLMAYSSRFCNIAAFLWAIPSTNEDSKSIIIQVFGPQVMWIFIYFLFIISSVKVHQVLCNRKLSSILLLVFGHAAFWIILHLDSFLKPFECS